MLAERSGTLSAFLLYGSVPESGPSKADMRAAANAAIASYRGRVRRLLRLLRADDPAGDQAERDARDCEGDGL